MSLTYGLEGIRQRNYKVWLLYPTSGDSGIGSESTTLLTTVNLIKGHLALAHYAAAFSLFSFALAGDADGSTEYSEKLGECRKDSISLTGEDGNSIEGNEKGTIILGKNCAFQCELINATPENILQLQDYVESKTPLYIVLEEVDGRTKSFPTLLVAPNDVAVSEDTHEIIFIGLNDACVLSSVENHTGGGISTVMVNVKDTVARLTDFRCILDIPYDLADF